MNNITKKTQIILFVGLIAAMILPFSSMDYAQADSAKKSFTTTDINKLLEKKLVQAKKEKSKTKDEDIKNEISREIERLEIFSKLVMIKEKSFEKKRNFDKIELLKTKAQELIVEYQNTIQSDEIEIAHSNESSVDSDKVIRDIDFDILQVRDTNCMYLTQLYDNQAGKGSSFENKIVIDHWSGYPTSISIVGDDKKCHTMKGQYLEVKLNTPTATCWNFMWPVDGSWNDMTCYKINAFEVVLVTTQAWYADGNKFSPNYGWDIMVI